MPYDKKEFEDLLSFATATAEPEVTKGQPELQELVDFVDETRAVDESGMRLTEKAFRDAVKGVPFEQSQKEVIEGKGHYYGLDEEQLKSLSSMAYGKGVENKHVYEVAGSYAKGEETDVDIKFRTKWEDDPEKKQMFNTFLYEQGEKKYRGVFEGIAERAKRGIVQTKSDMAKFALDYMVIPALKTVLQNDPQNAIAVSKALDIERETRGIIEAKDAVRGAGGLENAILGASEQVPNIFASVAAGVGTAGVGSAAYWTMKIAPGEYDNLKAHGVSDGVARVASLASAIPQAIIEVAQVKGMGGATVREGMRSTMNKAVLPLFTKVITETGKVYTHEMVEEVLQEVVSKTILAGTTYLDKNAPGVDWGKELADSYESLKETAGTMAVLIAPGSMVNAMGGIKDIPTYDKGSLMTPEGAAVLFKNDPAVALAIAFKDTLSRSDMKKLGVEGETTFKERQQIKESILQNVPDELMQIATMTPEELVVATGMEEAPQEAVEAPVAAQAVEGQVTPEQAQVPPQVAPEAVQPQIQEEVPSAEGIGAQVEEAGAEEGMVKGEEERVRVRDAEKNWLEAITGEKIEEPEGFGADNTIFKKSDVMEVWRRIKGEGGVKMYAGLPTDIIEGAVKVGGYLFEGGIRQFGKWSKQMIERFGVEIKPQLRQVWTKLQPARKEIARVEKTAKLGQKEAVRAVNVKERVKEQVATPEGLKLLKVKYLSNERVANTAYKFGVQELQEMHTQLADYAKEVLPPMRQGKVLGRIADAKTEAQRLSVVKTINRMAEKYKAETARYGEAMETTPAELLAYSKKYEARGAEKGYRAGALDLKATHVELTRYAKEFLPQEEQYRAMGAIAKARTPAETRNVAKAIMRIAGKLEKQAAVDELKEKMKGLDLKHMDAGYKEKIQSLLDSFSMTVHSDALLAKMQKVMDFTAEDDVGEMPYWKIDKAKRILADAGKMQIADMSADNVRKISDAISLLVYENAQANKYLSNKTLQDAEKVNKKAVAEIIDRHGKPFPMVPGKYAETRKQNIVGKIAITEQMSHESEIRHLAGDKGVVNDVLFNNPDQAQNKYLNILDVAKEAIAEFRNVVGMTAARMLEWAFEKVTVDTPTAISGGKFVPQIEMTRGERVAILCHWSDPNTRAELLKNKGQGITFKRIRGGPNIKLKIGDFEQVLASASKEEMALRDAILDYTQGPLRDAVNEMSQKLWRIDIWPRDDAFPRVRDVEYRETEPNKILRRYGQVEFEHQSILKERTGGIAPIVIDNILNLFARHVTMSAAYASKTDVMHDAVRLMRNKDFRRTVRESMKYGDDVLGRIEDTIRDYKAMDVVKLSSVEKGVRWFIRHAQVGVLGLKPRIMLYQTVSLITAMNEIDAKYIFNPQNLFSMNADTEAKIKKWSPKGKARLEGQGHDILTAGVGPEGINSFYGADEPGILGTLSKWGMKGIHGGDSQVMYRLWRAAEQEQAEKGLTGDNLMEKTARRFEQIVNRTQPTWDPLTMSHLQRAGMKHPLLKLAMMFSSQRNKNWNMAFMAIDEFNHSEGTAEDYGKLIKNTSIPTIVNATMLAGIRAAETGLLAYLLGPRGNEDERNKYADMLFDIMERLFGNWIIMGDLATTVERTIRGRHEGIPAAMQRGQENILSSAMGNILELIGDIAVTIEQTATGEKYAPGKVRAGQKKVWLSLFKALETGARTTGYFGIPLPALLQIIDRYFPTRTKSKKKKKPTPAELKKALEGL